MIRVRLERRAAPSRWFALAIAPAAIVITSIVTLGFVLLTGAPPLGVFRTLFIEPLTTGYGALEVLVAATPLLLTGLAVALAFRAGYWNIGAEGQLLAGAIFATWAGMNAAGLPRLVALVFVVVAGAIGGALWALTPALLRVRFGIDEVVTTLLLNPVALLVVSALLNGPWRNPETGFPESEAIATEAQFPLLAETSRLHLGLLIGLALIALAWFVVARTTAGLRMRAVGLGPTAARFAGIRVERTLLTVALTSGAVAGVAGAGEVAGLQYRLTDGFSSGLGYTGIVVATLAALSIPGVAAAAAFLGDVMIGASSAGRAFEIPSQLGEIVQGALLLVTVSLLLLRTHRVVLRRPMNRPAGKTAREEVGG